LIGRRILHDSDKAAIELAAPQPARLSEPFLRAKRRVDAVDADPDRVRHSCVEPKEYAIADLTKGSREARWFISMLKGRGMDQPVPAGLRRFTGNASARASRSSLV